MRLSESTNYPSLSAGKATVPTPTTVIHSPDNDSVRPRDDTLREVGGDGGVVPDEGPTSYGQVSRAIATGGARRTMHRTLRKGTDGTHMAMAVLAVVLVVMMERRSERG